MEIIERTKPSILLLFLVIGMSLAFPCATAQENSPHVIVSEISSTPEVFAGDTFTEIITLTNVGDKKADRVQLIVDIDDPFALIDTSSNIFVGSISVDNSKTVMLHISVDKKAQVATYTIDFEIEWEDSAGESYNQFNTFNVRVLGKPNIDIQETISNGDPFKVSAGESFIKTLNLENVGVENAYMVKISLDISYPFAMSKASSNIFIGDLLIGESKSVSVEISVDRNAVGVYSIPYIISHEDSYGWTYDMTGVFGVEVLGKPKVLVYETIVGESETKILAGDTFTKEFELSNIGGYETKRVQLSLEVAYPFMLTYASSNILFGDLGVGESKSVPLEFSVDRNAPVAVYSIPYTIAYENIYGERYEKIGLFGIQVYGKPQLLIDEVTVDPSPLTIGQNGLMIIRLTNIGSDVAYDTSIRVFGNKGILASSSAYIANINNKLSESVMLPVSLDNSLRSGTYILNITISNKDYFNNTYHLANLFELKISAGQPFIPPFYIGLTVGLVALGLLAYVMYNWNPRDDESLGVNIDVKKQAPQRRSLRLIFGVVMIFAVILPIPYIVHANLGNAGIVTYNKDIHLKMLPPKIQQICRLRGITTPKLLMVRHVEPNWITMVITTEQYPTGAAVEMTEHIIEWYVDWRDFDLANQAFQKLAISKVERLKEHEAFIEQLLYATRGPISLHSISKAAFYGGPVLFILCLTLIVQKRLAVWNLSALISAYSFQIWCLNTLASTHHIAVNTEWEYFGYAFFVMIPLSLYAWYFERTEGGQTMAKKMWALSRLLGIMRE